MDIGEARFTEEYRQFKGVVKDLERRLGSVIIQVYIPSQALVDIGTMWCFAYAADGLWASASYLGRCRVAYSPT